MKRPSNEMMLALIALIACALLAALLVEAKIRDCEPGYVRVDDGYTTGCVTEQVWRDVQEVTQ